MAEYKSFADLVADDVALEAIATKVTERAMEALRGGILAGGMTPCALEQRLRDTASQEPSETFTAAALQAVDDLDL